MLLRPRKKVADQPVTIVEPWKPLPGSQHGFYNYEADVLLYEGTRGPGKTDAQLMRFRRRVGIGYGPFWRGVVFDREYKNLEDIINKAKRWFTKYDDGAKWYSSKSDLKWVWPNGEELLFRHIAHKDDYNKYHGHEYPSINWNELTKYPSDELFEMMMSCNRSSYTPEKDGFIHSSAVKQKDGPPMFFRPDGTYGLPPRIPLEVTATTNPHGVGHNWVKRKFITPVPTGTPLEITTKVYDPATKEDVTVTKTQVSIFGSYRENPYLSPEYIASIKNIKDKNKRKAWLGGSWDIVAGGAIDDLWDASIHGIRRFNIPSNWHIDRSFDWGSSHPSSVGFWAEANGEEVVLPDGTIFCPKAGSLIRFAEIYLTAGIGTNTGLKYSATKIAQEIKKKELAMIEAGLISRRPSPGPADNQIRDVKESDVETIEKKMADEGIRWELSDKSKGSRKIGLQLFRDRLEAVVDKSEKPGIYFTEDCRYSLDLLPTLPRDEDNPDDIDTDSEDHIWDEVRYRVLKSSNRYAKKVKVKFST